MNLLTFDIEEWALARANGTGTKELYADYDRILAFILEQLDQNELKATFFCTGQMAEFFPQVIKQIQSYGHEIGCHSYAHSWLNKITVTEVREDTRKAIDILEQCIGEKVKSYRAPAFSIGESNKWAFEVLAETGIERDASVFPAVRDFGGFSTFDQKTPCVVDYQGTTIKEFPVCTVNILGRNVAYSGGGYFRFFPLPFIRRIMNKSRYSSCYFHIADLTKEENHMMTRSEYESYFKEPGSLRNRCSRYIKSNIGKATALRKLSRLLESEPFVSLEEADNQIDWSKEKVVAI